MPGRSPLIAVATALVLCLGTSDGAQATIICVPSFTAACPEGGGHVQKTDVEEAIGFLGSDGQADEVRIAAGTYTETNSFEPEPGFSSPETFEPAGSDPLAIVGAGPASTVLTGTGTKNVFLVNLAYNNSRAIVMRDLTVRIPSSFPDGGGGGYGSAFQLDEDVLDNVDIVSRNPESNGIASTVGDGNVFRNGELRGESGGSIGDALSADCFGACSLLVEDAIMRGASWSLVSSGGQPKLTARRVQVIGGRTLGAISSGGDIAVENSTMTLDDGIGLYVGPSTSLAAIHADHLTVLNSGSTYPALEAKRFGSTPGNGEVVVSNSILRGFSTGYKAETAIGPGIGHLSVAARYSNLPMSGTNVNGLIDLGTGNIDADPLFNPDLSLPSSSPSVDAGDPAAGGLPVDFAGAPRPSDGNGDGVAVRDQGAFEYQGPTVIVDPGRDPDKNPPQTTIAKGPGKGLAQGKAKFAFRSSEPGSSFTCKLDRRKPKRCASPKSYSGLKPGKHVFKVWATDPAGNKDPTPAQRKFRVPAPAS